MSALGVLPKVDAAVHADTTHERSETYAFARRWTTWLEERGVRVVTVNAKAERLPAVRLEDVNSVMIPAFTTWPHGGPSGMQRRQCTHDWKIAPIRRWLQANRDGQPVEQWLGITLDEVTRMRQSDVQYITNVYPFIKYLDRPWTRGMVMRWLQENGLEIPVKSSCVFCPYHDLATWREIKLAGFAGNGDWRKAIEVDLAIRDKRPGYRCYLVPQCVPLAEVDFRNEEDYGQLTLWGQDECEGMCFL